MSAYVITGKHINLFNPNLLQVKLKVYNQLDDLLDKCICLLYEPFFLRQSEQFVHHSTSSLKSESLIFGKKSLHRRRKT